MTSVEHAVAWLKAQGVDWMATLCGHGLDPLFRAAKQAGFRLIDTRNEQTAGYVAECYGRLTRKPGICAVSSGVAHINALTGVTNAWFDNAPMLLISGAGSHRTAGMHHFQDMDQVGTAAPITRYSRVLDHPDRTLQILEEAWSEAQRGPVHLTYPMDVQTAEVSTLFQPTARVPRQPAVDILSVTNALAAAQRPVMVAGSGAWYRDEGEDLLAFCEDLSIPLVVPIWDRGVVYRESPVFAGVIGAATGGPRILQDADLVLMAGARSDYRVSYLQPEAFAPQCQVLYTSQQWREIRREALFLDPFHTWLAEVQRRRRSHIDSVEATAHQQRVEGQLHAIDIVDVLRPIVAEDATLVIDGGSIGQWAHQLLTDRYPGHWLTCGPSGVVGYGIGGAMAARIADPRRPIVLLSGDGAFTFNVADLECAARQKLSFVAIVADDEGWGITRIAHVRQFGEAIASSLGPIAFDKLAESLGAQGRQATTREQLQATLREALASPAVTVIHAPIVGGNP
ncbi:MAG: thiamine pyrophosphate-binding protein [Bryobacterales bacterium]|nr:thiamine pyrophosphate-binding protein [Bryobacterales bacterium]